MASEHATLAAIEKELEVTYATGHSPCPTSVDPTLKEVIFAFEGAGGYSPSHLVFEFRNPHTGLKATDQFETGEEIIEWKDRDERGNLKVRPKSWSVERFKLYQEYLRRILEDHSNAILIDALSEATSKLETPVPKIVLYYPWNLFGLAARCAVKMENLYANAKHPLAISAIGFSLGGYSTVLFNRILNWAGVRLKNVLTLDPVPFTPEIYNSIFPKRNELAISVPGNHDSWINYFQRGDVNTLFEKYPLHGAKLKGNVRNRIPLGYGGEPVAEHMDLPSSHAAVSEMVRMLQQ